MGEAGDMPRVKDIGRGRGRGKEHLGDKEGELRMRLGWNAMADCTVARMDLGPNVMKLRTRPRSSKHCSVEVLEFSSLAQSTSLTANNQLTSSIQFWSDSAATCPAISSASPTVVPSDFKFDSRTGQIMWPGFFQLEN
ncbi:hypothetical protein NEUTE1DRAFT_109942 [Neurospora tetrasperma FGSC 2508]|uniref:Uncharacterized protein n=1 Tax=Neurospora tetrasperma (strain FGSC 2508 / ATCC MYA-4615 / P0657) TaxID=510951 RepID=F8MM72_NEUT8|nr:uncharacterized protein NEUTE1DRAFT_109942 [Neurospora tetrasperma FGSC 2508]EGO57746.1 hypothetical protein NEUTE1DRAFT_109942 [Neurospora tetrasperma FGSC 2508]